MQLTQGLNSRKFLVVFISVFIWLDIEVISVLLSFNADFVKTVIAAILGVIGKNMNKANKLLLGLNNLCIDL